MKDSSLQNRAFCVTLSGVPVEVLLLKDSMIHLSRLGKSYPKEVRDFYITVISDYQKRNENVPEIPIKSLLTHVNPQVREVAKDILSGQEI